MTRRIITPAVFLLSLLPALWLAWGLWRNTLGAEPIERVQQETGVWAIRFLLATLAVTPLRRLTAWRSVIQLRRMLGLFAFFYASLHVVNYVVLEQFFDVGAIVEDVLERPWITIGVVAFLLLLPLAVTSTKGWIRRLGGRRWNVLHRLVYLAAIGGALHFLLAVKQDTREPLVYAALFAGLLGLRLWWWAAPKLPRAPTRREGAPASGDRSLAREA